MTPEQAAKLREKFPASAIGKLPKGGTTLDYVGHAAVTNRLLQVDPEWTWEPLALTPEGVPAVDRAGNLWIKLTVAGVTRLGVGDGRNAKECISDALRNAAMRFGVALDLWAKEDLDTPKTSARHTPKSEGGKPDGAGVEASPASAGPAPASSVYTDADVEGLLKLVEEHGGDVEKTRAGAETAKALGKLDVWLPNAHKHWESQPVASEFAKKAADVVKAAGEKQQARAAKAQADRDEGKAA